MKNFLKGKKVAIVYDRVNKWGGAERVLLSLHKIFPEAQLFTSVYDPKKASWAKVFPKINTSFLQKVPFAKNFHEGIGWLMPLAFESFNFENFDLVISVTSESAKGIITVPHTKHICYMLSPTRYLWSHYQLYFKNPILKFLSKPVVSYLRYWDKVAAQRPDKIISISTEVKNRIKKYYDRDSEIIFPPVNFSNLKKTLLRGPRFKNVAASRVFFENYSNYFLVVSRLVGYKKVDLVVKTFNKLGKKLIIVGTGHQYKKLKRIAAKNIFFVGNVSDKKLDEYYKNAHALIMPQEEDFGLVSVEAQSFGTPVIAYGSGGAKDTIVDGKTGILYNNQTIDSLIGAIAKFEKIGFNHKYIRENAEKFNQGRFERQLQRSLVRAYTGGRGRNTPLAKIKK